MHNYKFDDFDKLIEAKRSFDSNFDSKYSIVDVENLTISVETENSLLYDTHIGAIMAMFGGRLVHS